MGDSNSWGEGVTVYGIEEGDGYGWNETEFKLDGVDDYIEVYPQADVNIENGLTFEFYANSEKEGNIPMLAKTNLYACRLYNKVLTSDEVKANYDKTVAYHNLLTK